MAVSHTACGLQGDREFTTWNAWLIVYTAVLPIWVCKSYSVICGHFSTGEADFDWQLWEQKLFFVHKTSTALQEMRGGVGPHAHSFLGLSRISSSLLSAITHLWHSDVCEKSPLCGSHEAMFPLGNPGLVEGPGAWAQSQIELQNTPELFVGGWAWGRTILTVANGKAGECDQKLGLQFTGKMIIPEKEILLKSQRTKTFEASSGK